MEWNGMEKAADIRPCPLSAGGRVSFLFFHWRAASASHNNNNRCVLKKSC